LHLLFSYWFQINRKIVHTIWFQFDWIRFWKKFSVCRWFNIFCFRVSKVQHVFMSRDSVRSSHKPSIGLFCVEASICLFKISVQCCRFYFDALDVYLKHEFISKSLLEVGCNNDIVIQTIVLCLVILFSGCMSLPPVYLF